MNLTITITDEQFTRLQDALKIHREHFIPGKVMDDEYALRIIWARQALGLAVNEAACVIEGVKNKSVDLHSSDS